MRDLVQAQWGLNQTSDSVYSISKELLQAATSDNVQPLAIMACEQFGNTLAISGETRQRIQRTVVPTSDPAIIGWLKLKVGFMKGDCVTKFGQNDAGLRFLALAAALTSSISVHHCADALMLMLERTTSDRLFLPTIQHLTNLMSSLQGRCILSDFANIVVGYNSTISGAIHKARGKESPKDYMAHNVPDSKGLVALVEACRHLQRLGDHELSSVVVEAGKSAPWVAAFARWSLELPPLIYFDGKAIIPQSGSPFIIIVSPPGEDSRLREDIKVTERFKLDSIQDLVVQCSSHNASRFHVPLKTFGSLIQERLGNQKDAVFAALPLAITILSAGGKCPTPESEGHEGTQQFTVTRPKAFPSTNVILQTMSHIFDSESEFSFDSPPTTVKSFRHLPQVEDYLKSTANVPYCWGPPPVPQGAYVDSTATSWWANDPLDPRSCAAFCANLSVVCNYVLLTSIFDDTVDLYLRTPREDASLGATYNHSPVEDSLYASIYLTLALGRSFEPPTSGAIWEEVGHFLTPSPRGDWKNTLVSSTKTHVFWYSILDESALGTTDHLRITSYRGRLMYERQSYDQVWCDDSSESRNMAPGGTNKHVNSATHKLYPDAKAQWEIHTQLGGLYGNLTLTSILEPETRYGGVDSWLSISMLTSFVLVDCKHPVDSPATEKRPEWKYWSPGELGDVAEGELKIFPVAGGEELQLCCLGLIHNEEQDDELDAKPVIRGRACFDCCIKVCEMERSRFLIL
ncbi:hypothetical protein F5X98DRAFT_337870 [Xylaria grammica]|nr:hypothetical protein F5X98DRAFT_337870 [Xylaria grammica]